MPVASFQDHYNALNPKQQLAVDTLEGPVLVLAGPGTGKTQVLTLRIANLLLETDAKPQEILALTYTESGVHAMKERLRDIIGTSAYQVHIHTFHSFCSTIIQQNPDEFAFSLDLEPLSDLERVTTFRAILDMLPLSPLKPFGAPYLYLKAIQSSIQQLKREGFSPDTFETLINTPDITFKEKKDRDRNIELITVFREYEKALKQKSRYDYEDMINFVARAFHHNEDLLRKYQESYQYLLVDEFQDTNQAQLDLLYTLCSYEEWSDNPNLFVVGDDDQAIFRFQGASVDTVLSFARKYPKAEIITLDINYRSTQRIIDIAQHVIQKNTIRVATELDLEKTQHAPDASDSAESSIILRNAISSHLENYSIAQEIQKLLSTGVEAREIAVIYRNNADAADIADMLARHEIPYRIAGGENVLETGVIVRLLHLLRVIQRIESGVENPELFTLLSFDFIGCDKLDVLKLSRYAYEKERTKSLTLFDCLLNPPTDEVSLTSPDTLKQIGLHLQEWNQLTHNKTCVDFLQTVIEESGYLNWILRNESSISYLNKLNSFFSEIRRLNATEKNLTLTQLLETLDLMKEHNISIDEESLDIDSNSVLLTTAHSSKGQQFEYVFVPKLIDKKWGNNRSPSLIKLPAEAQHVVQGNLSEQELSNEDERRLFYVVVTRAKKGIFFSTAERYYSAGTDHSAIPSQFLGELPEGIVEVKDSREFEHRAEEVLTLLVRQNNRSHIELIEDSDFLHSILHKTALSPSSINTYLECAYKFKLKYLYRIPEERSTALMLGSVVHAALEAGIKTLFENGTVSLQFLQDEADHAIQRLILNDHERSNMHQQAYAVLQTYYETYEEEFATKPEASAVRIETKMNQIFLDEFIKLTGVIDRIDILPNKKLRIIDYKTGKPKTRGDIMGTTKTSRGDLYRQVLFYALLMQLNPQFNTLPQEITLDFTGTQSEKPKRETFVPTIEDIAQLKDEVRNIYRSMHNLEFERTKKLQTCQNCQFRYHCWPDGIPASSGDQLELMAS